MLQEVIESIQQKVAIKNREGGNHPIPDEEFEKDIAELLAYLKQAK